LRKSFLILSLLLAGCCGYQLEESLSLSDLPTISIPYVECDQDGELTAAIVKELATSGVYRYQPCGGEWILQVSIVSDYDENIGFRYDRSRKGKLKREIIPVETRRFIMVDVSLVSAATGCAVRGPIRLQASVDFDHDDYTIRRGINTFSLGQLTDIDSAHDVAITPLNKKLAEKIVDYVIYGW
jgi:hypothetical protein